MKLYLDQFVDKDVVELEFVLSPAEVIELLGDCEFEPLTPLRLHLKARRSGSAITLSGDAKGEFGYECGRCLSERHFDLAADLELVYLSRDAWEASLDGEEDVELTSEDLDVAFYEGKDEILLDEELREELLLALLPYPICQVEDHESCEAAFRALLGEAHLDTEEIRKLEEEAMDERWGPLKELKQKMFEKEKD